MLRIYPALLRAGLAEAIAYRAEMLVWMLTTTMPLVMWALWHAVAREAAVGRFGPSEVTAYYVSSLVVRLLTGAWVAWLLNMEIRDGTLSMRLMRPIHPLFAYSAENIAALPLRLTIVLPGAIGLLVSQAARHLTHDPWIVAGALVATFLAWLLTFFTQAMVGMVAFYWQSALGLVDLWFGVWGLLSGYILPLELFPARLRPVIELLPFRFMLSFPVELLTGRHGQRPMLTGLATQLAYVVAAGLATHLLWRRALRHFGAVGG